MVQEIFKRTNESYLEICQWIEHNKRLKVGFTTKNGGVSEHPYETLNLGLHVNDKNENVINNRHHLAQELKVPLNHWVCGEQVHDIKIKHVTKADRNKGTESVQSDLGEIDGLIATESNILCTAFFADCVPLFFYDKRLNIVGIAHAGWKGTVKEIGAQMVKSFVQLGSQMEDLFVAIGPCISKMNYEVNDHVIKHIDENFVSKVVTDKGEGKYLLDLKQLNVEILLQNGVMRNNIDITTYCTYEHEQLFYSYRRDN